jgi:hypothetical protein
MLAGYGADTMLLIGGGAPRREARLLEDARGSS